MSSRVIFGSPANQVPLVYAELYTTNVYAIMQMQASVAWRRSFGEQCVWSDVAKKASFSSSSIT